MDADDGMSIVAVVVIEYFVVNFQAIGNEKSAIRICQGLRFHHFSRTTNTNNNSNSNVSLGKQIEE